MAAILEDYPNLRHEDILACLAYAHAVLANERLDDVGCRARVNFLVDRCAGTRLAHGWKPTGMT